MFQSLKEAILKVLHSADNEGCSPDLTVVDADALRELQAETNIFFVEPTDPQIEVV